MTRKILFRLSRNGQCIDRIFDTLEDATSYLSELTKSLDLKYIDEERTKARLSNTWKITSNYSLKNILKKIPINKNLSDTYPFNLAEKRV